MAKKFDMQFIRYMNLFTKITKVETKHCFSYNNMLVFVVGRNFIEMAIGRDNYNLKKISDILGRRIRVLPEPTSEKDLKKFVQILVYPVEFENIEIMNNIETKEKEALITTSGREPRAMLIGRGRIREKELKEILEQYFQVKNIRIN